MKGFGLVEDYLLPLKMLSSDLSQLTEIISFRGL